MGDDQRFEKWASGIRGVVSLVLVLNLARIYAGQWRAVLPARAGAHVTKPLTRNPPPARQAASASMDSARVEPAFADSARIKQGATNLARVEPGATAVKPNNKNVRGAALAVARQSRPRKMENAAASASGRATLKAQAGRIKPDAPPGGARAAGLVSWQRPPQPPLRFAAAGAGGSGRSPMSAHAAVPGLLCAWARSGDHPSLATDRMKHPSVTIA